VPWASVRAINRLRVRDGAMPLAAMARHCRIALAKGIAHFDKIIRLGVFEDPREAFEPPGEIPSPRPLSNCSQTLLETERAKGLQ